MSEEVKEEEGAEEKKGGKGKLLMIVGLLVVLIAGGGGGYYFMFMTGGGDEASESKSSKKKKKKKRKKSKKDLEDPEEEASSLSGDAKESLRVALQDDEEVKHVIELQPFIVNLADVEEARYLRMTVSLGIGGDEGGEAEPNPIFLAKVKNAMLAVLSVKKSDDVLTVAGKSKLRKQLLDAAQTAAEDGHVEAIYITDFIVQL